MNKPSFFDIYLHNISLQIANAVKLVTEMDQENNKEDFKKAKADLIEAYTHVRRHINSKRGTRFGARYAYNLMTNGEI